MHGLSNKILIDRCAGLRPGAMTSPTASSKHPLRVLAKRYQTLHAAAEMHCLRRQPRPDPLRGRLCQALRRLTRPRRIRGSRTAIGCPGLDTERPTPLYRTVIVRMRLHQPTIDYVARRTKEGLSKKDVIRCIKRFLAREVYQRVMTDHRTRHGSQHPTPAGLDL